MIKRGGGKVKTTRYYGFFSIIDGATGKRLARRSLGRGSAQCLGFEGDVVWMRGAGLGLHARSTATCS